MRPTPAKYLRDLLEHTNLIAYLKRADGQYVYVNRMFEVAAKVPAEKIVGRCDRDIFPPAVADLFTEQDRAVMAKKSVVDFEETVHLPDGAQSFITSKFPLFDEKGKVWAVGGVCTNVTTLKKTEEALRASETRLNAIISNALEGCMIVNREGVIRYGSPAFLPILGYKPEEMAGRHIREFMHPDDLGVSLPGFARVAQTPGLVSPRELRIRHKDGTWRTIEGRATNHMATPHIEGVLINFRDVTARRLAENHLIESERLYRALVETTNTGYVVVDPEGRVVDANAEYVRLSGRRDIGNIRGRSVVEWTAPEDRERNAREVARCLSEGKVRDLEIHYIDAGGRRTPIEINATVVQMGDKPLIMTVCRDITARKRAEEALRLSEARLRTAFESIPCEIFALSADGRYSMLNGAARRNWGVSVGQRPEETEVDPQALAVWQDNNRRAFAGERVVGEVQFGSGEDRRWVYNVIAPVIDDGKVAGILGINLDITPLKRAEEEVRRSREILAEAERLAKVGSVSLDIPTGKVYRSEGIHSIFGTDKDEMPDEHLNFLRYVHPEDRVRIRQALELSSQSGRPLAEDYRIVRPDGSLRFIHVEGQTHKDERGRPARFFAWLQDVTERRQAEEALRRSEAMLAEAERMSGMGSFSYDPATRKMTRSAGALRVYGVSPEQMRGGTEDTLRIVHPDDRERVQAGLMKCLKEGLPHQDEYRITRPDGAARIIHVEVQVEKDANGDPVRFFGWLQDITERRTLEEKVLQISDRERRNIGHDLHDDLGQQLTGISLLGRALQERLAGQSSPEAPAMAELLKHVDAALARTREMSRGLQSVPPRPEGLLDALSGLASHVSATAKVSCTLQAARNVAVPDPEVANHLYRIAQEAVSNAVRHGRPREIGIALFQKPEGLTLSVTDDGAGLLDTAKSAPGMGLDIMRHRASLIHGTLTVSSQSGQGTQIICRVPVGPRSHGDRE